MEAAPPLAMVTSISTGVIEVSDVLVALSDFGCTTACVADVDGDGMVGVNDILDVLAQFGVPCQ